MLLLLAFSICLAFLFIFFIFIFFALLRVLRVYRLVFILLLFHLKKLTACFFIVVCVFFNAHQFEILFGWLIFALEHGWMFYIHNIWNKSCESSANRIWMNEFFSFFLSLCFVRSLPLFLYCFSLFLFHPPVQKKNTNNAIFTINFDEANSFLLLLLYFYAKMNKAHFNIIIIIFSPIQIFYTHTERWWTNLFKFITVNLFAVIKRRKMEKLNIRSEKASPEHIYSLLLK